MSGKTVTLRLTDMPVVERHPKVFDTWEGLEPYETLRIINDYDPKALRAAFESELKGTFDWSSTSTPGEWVVDIKKTPPPAATGEELKRKVNTALEAVRPYLQADGGDVELLSIDEESWVVTVKLKGKCGGCPSAAMTLKSGVESTVKRYAPEIKRVEAA